MESKTLTVDQKNYKKIKNQIEELRSQEKSNYL